MSSDESLSDGPARRKWKLRIQRPRLVKAFEEARAEHEKNPRAPVPRSALSLERDDDTR